MSTSTPTSTYEILKWCNSILQGQFRKYSSVISQVGVFCVRGSHSLEEAEAKFKEVNLAVARISFREYSTDTSEILGYAQKFNSFLSIKKIWQLWKLLEVGKSAIVKNKAGEEKTGLIISLNPLIKIQFDDRTLEFSSNFEQYGDKRKITDYFTIQEIIG